MLTQERLKELLHYDPETGVFTWRVAKRGIRAGVVAGTLSKRGYRDICIDGKVYKEHRLAWLYMTGGMPLDLIDHIDMNRVNNRWSNLREANKSQNGYNRPAQRNNLLGLKGVSRKRDKFQARLGRKSLGVFPTAEEAHAAYVKAANDNFGEFARAA